MIPDVTIVASGSSIFEMRMSAKLAAEEKLTIWGFRRRYLQETQRTPGTRPHFATLGAEAVSRLSIAGVDALITLLRATRQSLRLTEDHDAADVLTAGIRDLDSRMQIQSDLLS
jgi:hypothetical protein